MCTNVHSKLQSCADCAHCVYCAPFAPLCTQCTLCTLCIAWVCSVHRYTLQNQVIWTPLCSLCCYFWHYVHTYILVMEVTHSDELQTFIHSPMIQCLGSVCRPHPVWMLSLRPQMTPVHPVHPAHHHSQVCTVCSEVQPPVRWWRTRRFMCKRGLPRRKDGEIIKIEIF